MSYLFLKTPIIFTFLKTLTFNIMISQNIALYSWTNGVIMIAIFALVCIVLVGILINFIMSGKPKDGSENLDTANSFNDDDSAETKN